MIMVDNDEAGTKFMNHNEKYYENISIEIKIDNKRYEDKKIQILKHKEYDIYKFVIPGIKNKSFSISNNEKSDKQEAIDSKPEQNKSNKKEETVIEHYLNPELFKSLEKEEGKKFIYSHQSKKNLLDNTIKSKKDKSKKDVIEIKHDNFKIIKNIVECIIKLHNNFTKDTELIS